MQINSAVIANPKITLQAKGLYAYFVAMADEKKEVSIKVKEISEDLNIEERTIRKYKNELVAFEVIEVENKKDGQNKFATNVHKILK